MRVVKVSLLSIMMLLCSLIRMENFSCTEARMETGSLVMQIFYSEIVSRKLFPGSVIGNNKKGVFLRSQDPDRSSFIQECPCQVNLCTRIIFLLKVMQHFVAKMKVICCKRQLFILDKSLAEDG